MCIRDRDTQKELLPETKDGYYLWKAEENMELEASFVEVPKEPEVTPEEPEVKPEEPEVKPEEPEVKPEEPEVKPEEPEEEPETEATPEEPEVTPEEVTPTDLSLIHIYTFGQPEVQDADCRNISGSVAVDQGRNPCLLYTSRCV